MGDSFIDNQQGRSFNNSREGGKGGFRGNRGPNNRDQGGFRIRLSDNEMNASRRIQETFNLRSTVAVLGFSVRTIAQMLEEGKLDDFLKSYRSQTNQGGSDFNRVNQRNFSTNKINEYKKSEQKLVAELNEKYGPGQLDPNTGVFTPTAQPTTEQ